MKIGDLINFRGTPHIVIKIRPSIPVVRAGQEIVVLKDAKTLETRTIPTKWIRR